MDLSELLNFKIVYEKCEIRVISIQQQLTISYNYNKLKPALKKK